MKLSKMGIKTSKTRGTDEMFAHEFLLQSGQLKKFSAGVYGLGPMLLLARENIINIIRKNLNRYDCVEQILPTLQPKQLWVNSGRWQGYVDSGTMFTLKGKNGEYCMAPTAEEFSMEFINNSLKSYRDLEVNLYQFGSKYRDEIRVRGGLFRSKEFLMKDGYSFHENKENMEKEFFRMKQCYLDIYSEVGLDVVAVDAVNTMGGKVSNEFMCFTEYGEDVVLYDKERNIAFNVEVLEDEELKKILLEKHPGLDITTLEEVKGIELGHIFQNNQFYSKSMNGKFINREGKEDYYWMGCYGIGVNRVLYMSVIKNLTEENGLVWPLNIAPYKCNIINLYDEKLNAVAEDLYNNLLKNDISVAWDDRDMTMGSKLKDNELFGLPIVIIIGKKYFENGLFEVENRITKEKSFLTAEQVIDMLK